MSGGHWQYVGYQIRDACETIEQDEYMQKNCPRLSRVVGELGRILYDIEHEADWHLSDDSYIENWAEWETKMLARLQEAVNVGL